MSSPVSTGSTRRIHCDQKSMMYSTDGEGRMSTVAASTGQNPVTAATYNPSGQITALTFGSSDSDSFTFDADNGRMTKYVYSVGSSPQTDTGKLTWNSNGSLQKLEITDQLNPADSQTCTYTHDTLGRVASSNCRASAWSQTFSYDPFGNITKTVPEGSAGTAFQPSYDYTNNTNRITSSPFTYGSNNGDMTADNSHVYSWDTENKLTGVDSGTSSGICETYDALGRLVEQDTGSACAISPASTIETVCSPSGTKLALMNGSTLVKDFVPLPSGAQAVYGPPGLDGSSGLEFYRHADWLGSSRLATTPSQTLNSSVAYAPFGENYVSSGWLDLTFTGQNQYTVSSGAGGVGGLYDFLYREHSPVQGRWLSPDPAGLGAVNPSDPQSWNRYAYVGNRPLNTVDQQGLYIPIGWGGDDDDDDGGSLGPCDPTMDPSCIPNPILPPGLQTPPGSPSSQGTGLTELPPGLDTSPLNIGDLLGQTPGTECDFGECVPASGFVPAIPAVGPCLANPVCTTGAILVTAGALIYYYSHIHQQTETPNYEDDCTLFKESYSPGKGILCYYDCSSGLRCIEHQFGMLGACELTTPEFSTDPCPNVW